MLTATAGSAMIADTGQRDVGFAHYCGMVNGGGSACLATKTSAETVDMTALGKQSMDIDWAWDNAIA